MSDIYCYRRSNVIPVPVSYGSPPIWRLPNGDTFQNGGDPYGGRQIFAMHANCYSLLVQFSHPQPIPVTRLLEACRSCVVLLRNPRVLSWGPGHDYGGIMRLRNGYPWGEMDDYAGLMGYVQTPYHNTWSIPEIIARLQPSRRKKEGSKQTGQSMRKRPKRRSRQTGQSMRKRLKRPPAKLTTVGNRNMVSNFISHNSLLKF